ncbi:uncharacterized protein KD926_004165 [Aspergillus affinis]|uniref:uncharacterized protein n=1 Tax=Aspergillus affinis TaxID=1070780 RepID=UPI0022FE4354|nr:uncharacterized protein KD926_004165 [Aspergillus affinis]KAI9046327.1 hypothetical protein KD926_004165 [Aspergillus affinis]
MGASGSRSSTGVMNQIGQATGRWPCQPSILATPHAGGDRQGAGSQSPKQMFMLLVKATLIFRMLKPAFETPGLFIRHCSYNGSAASITPSSRPGYNMLRRPFEALHQIKSLYMRFYQVDLQQLMMDLPFVTQGPGLENNLRVTQSINGWLHSHRFFWNYPRDNDRCGLRAEWIKSALTQNDSSFFEFHRYYWEIHMLYPDMVKDYDPVFQLLLKDMHIALVSLYGFVIERESRPEGPQLRPWHNVFRRIVPADLMDVPYDLVVESNYREYMGLYGYRYETGTGGIPEPLT